MTTFTTDWFSYAIKNFEAVKALLGDVNNILEIGVFEGRSTCWQLENMLSDTGTITCVDPFLNKDDPHPITTQPKRIQDADEQAREALFRANVAEIKKPGQTVEILADRSYTALGDLIHARREYDFVYVDGNHASFAALTDACMSFGLLKRGGIMLLDDYLWDHEPDHLDRCKMSIDAFVNMFAKKVRPIIINYQLAVVKL